MKTRRILALVLSLALLICLCSVSMPVSAEGTEPTAISLDKSELTMLLGGELAHLTAALEPAGAETTITWTSDDWRVAKVSNGNVISVGEGTATITAKTANGLTATCALNVITEEKLITNDVFAKDTDGNPIIVQSGCAYKFGDTYYWYGVNFSGSMNYYNSLKQGKGTTGSSSWSTIRCYSSKDLVTWKFEGDVATQRVNNWPRSSTWLGRLGVAYNAKNDNYVMMGQEGSGVFFATSDTPNGPFTHVRVQSGLKALGSFSNGTGDMTVFWDYKTGKAYIVFCCDGVTVEPYKQDTANTLPERDELYVAELNDDFTEIVKITKVYDGKQNNLGREGGREANCMFTYAGYYYYTASGLRGWNTSPTFMMGGATVPTGPYVDANGKSNNMTPMQGSSDDYSHVTQVVGVITLDTPVTEQAPNGQLCLEYGDRWCDFAGNGIGYSMWAPLSFTKGNFDWPEPVYHSMSQFYVDVEKGTWAPGPNNNYILNPAFEGDRVAGTLGAIQGYVNDPCGWDVETTAGQTAQINYGGNRGTSAAEKEFQLLDGNNAYCSPYAGNYSWYHGYTKRNEGTDAYKTTTKQTIKDLPNGTYTMYGWVKSSGGQNTCDMYVKTGDKEYKTSLATAINDWTLVVLSENIEITNGQCEVGVYSDAAADQWVMFDDLALIKNSSAAPAEPGVSTDKDSYAIDEQITATVTVADSVEKAYFVGENGVGLAANRSKVDNGDGTATWTLTFSLGTIGSRVLSVYADGVDTGMKAEFDIVYPAASGEPVVLAVMPPLNVKANEAFTVTITTNAYAQNVRLFSESGVGFVPSVCTYVEQNGNRVWTYTTVVGTAGQRSFTAKAAAEDNVYVGDTIVNLHVA